MKEQRPTSPGLSRVDFLDRVRRGFGRADDDAPVSPPPPPEVDDALVRRCGPGEHLVERFAAAATAAGMTVHRCRGEALGATLGGVLASLAARSVTLAVTTGSPLAGLGAELERAGVALVDWREADGLERHYDVDAGVTDVAAAVAETGTLVIQSGPGRSRGAPLVPPVHVAIVEATQIVPDLIDFWGGVRDLPAATVLITGPSKTADIEGILITGVHGPGQVHILLVE